MELKHKNTPYDEVVSDGYRIAIRTRIPGESDFGDRTTHYSFRNYETLLTLKKMFDSGIEDVPYENIEDPVYVAFFFWFELEEEEIEELSEIDYLKDLKHYDLKEEEVEMIKKMDPYKATQVVIEHLVRKYNPERLKLLHFTGDQGESAISLDSIDVIKDGKIYEAWFTQE